MSPSTTSAIRAGALLLAATLGTAPAARAADAPPARPCTVSIASPANGETVSQSGTVSGRADIPDADYLWVLTRPKGFDGWWPQGGGAASVIGGAWDLEIFYGSPQDVGSPFEVVALPVDAKTNDALRQWYANATARHDFTPIRLPRPATGCPAAKVTVKRTS
jgi:hypothetical protein